MGLGNIFNKKQVEPASSATSSQATAAKRLNSAEDSKVKASAAVRAERNADNDGLHKAEIPYKGDPENQTLVIDVDETLLFGDIYKRDLRKAKVRKQIEKEGYTIKQTKLGHYYVLRPGAEELLKDLYESGHKIILCSRDLRPYLNDLIESEQALKKYSAGFLSRGDLINKANQDFVKSPKHPDNLGFLDRTKNFFHGLFVRCPKYCFKKFASIFSGRPVWFEEGRGVAGKYPPNAIDLLNESGNNSLNGFPPSHILIDNYAEMKTGDADAQHNYWGRAYRDSVASGDFAVISPNVVYQEGKKPHCFLALAPEPKDADGNYQWVTNIKAAVDRGWREQYKLTTGKEVKN
ncbi:MAG: NIF family HAD-type phosphatase [Cyanobacteria bacterium]|nr:NIF family HAD-type phosphatase [Cyanobacteriota bacterium]MDA1021297.1 NIF family HAD-type phosphatase [Cyanobacteriota bacterium]